MSYLSKNEDAFMSQNCVLIPFKPISDTSEGDRFNSMEDEMFPFCQVMLTSYCKAYHVHVTVAESTTKMLPKAERNAESHSVRFIAVFVMLNSAQKGTQSYCRLQCM